MPTPLVRPLALALLLAACDRTSPPPPASSPAIASTAVALPATSPPATVLAPTTARPAPRSPRPLSDACKTELDLNCPPSYEDGCIGGRTIDHACVKVGAVPGPTCDAEIALICPGGETNGCGTRPPVSDHHICVLSKKTLPSPTPRPRIPPPT